MLDKFDRKLDVGDLIVHCERGYTFLGIVIEEKQDSVKYIIVQNSKLYYKSKYGIKSSFKVIKIDPTPEIMNAPFKDYRGITESGTVAEAVKFTWNAHQSS